MSTRVRDLPSSVGVECPKKTGEMDKDTSCRECEYWSRCMAAIMGALGDDGL